MSRKLMQKSSEIIVLNPVALLFGGQKGTPASGYHEDGIAIGQAANVTANGGIAIGRDATSAQNAVTLGMGIEWFGLWCACFGDDC